MAGRHSQWAGIKRKKKIELIKKGAKIFSKLSERNYCCCEVEEIKIQISIQD